MYMFTQRHVYMYINVLFCEAYMYMYERMPSKCTVVGSNPTRGSFFFEEYYLGQVVLCCFVFLLCCVALPSL